MIEVRTAAFSGPLDLLLQLIDKAELRIEDIFVSEITAQYLAIVNAMQTDMDGVSEFITVGAELVYLKSRRLLPEKEIEAVEEEEETDPEEVFIERLKAYKECRERAELLFGKKEEGNRLFTRLPEDLPAAPEEASIKNTDPASLFAAFQRVLLRQQTPAEPLKRKVVRDTYTVRLQTVRLRTALKKFGSVLFEDLFEPDADKMEKVVTFMALLEMMAHGEAKARQEVPFGPIHVTAGELRDNLPDGEDENG